MSQENQYFQSKPTTHYDILQLPFGSSYEVVKKRFWELSKAIRDPQTGNAKQGYDDMLKRINVAFDSLKTPESKLAYDAAHQPPPTFRTNEAPSTGSQQSHVRFENEKYVARDFAGNITGEFFEIEKIQGLFFGVTLIGPNDVEMQFIQKSSGEVSPTKYKNVRIIGSLDGLNCLVGSIREGNAVYDVIIDTETGSPWSHAFDEIWINPSTKYEILAKKGQNIFRLDLRKNMYEELISEAA